MLYSLLSLIFIIIINAGNINAALPTSPQPNVGSSCPPGYSQPANSGWKSCYKVSTDFKSRTDAVAQCKLDNGSLASVSNAFVNSYLNFLATSNDATSIWLGVLCFNGDSTTCINDDGTPFVYNNFLPGQPKSSSECVYMSADGRDSQQWSSFDCAQKFQYACETVLGATGYPVTTTTTVQPTPKNQGCPPNYQPFQSMCYSFVHVTHEISANNAFDLCKQTPGGMLATVPNKQVNSFLVSIRPKRQTSMVAFGLVCSKIQYNGDTSSCKWDDGTPFKYQAFANEYLPLAPHGTYTYGKGCCDFKKGDWQNCYDCDGQISFDSYICQAPMH